jgi:hypothetical protein
MRMILIVAALAAGVVTIAAAPPVAAQQNMVVKKKSCTPDTCIKMVRQRGYPFATAAAWCAAHNNGC